MVGGCLFVTYTLLGMKGDDEVDWFVSGEVDIVDYCHLLLFLLLPDEVRKGRQA